MIIENKIGGWVGLLLKVIVNKAVYECLGAHACGKNPTFLYPRGYDIRCPKAADAYVFMTTSVLHTLREASKSIDTPS